jgi:hypothetical protein
MAGMDLRRMARYYLVSRADILLPSSSDPLWGAVANISRTGVALYIRQHLTPKTKVTLKLHFRAEDGREITETVPAMVIWQRGEEAGLAFEQPILANSPTAQATPYLADFFAKKEAGSLTSQS